MKNGILKIYADNSYKMIGEYQKIGFPTPWDVYQDLKATADKAKCRLSATYQDLSGVHVMSAWPMGISMKPTLI